MMFSVYTDKMPVIANGANKYDGNKTKSKIKKISKESLHVAKKAPGELPGSKSSNDIHIVDDVDNEVLNLPDLAINKRDSSCPKAAVKPVERNTNVQAVDAADSSVRKSENGDAIDISSNEIATYKHAGSRLKQVHNHVSSNLKPIAKHGRSDLLLDSSSLKTAIQKDNNSNPPAENHKTVRIPTITSRLNHSVSVSAVLPGREEENHIEVLTTATPKRKDSLILHDAIPGTSYAFEEQNGSLNDSLSIQREFSKLSMISNRSTDSKIRNSAVQMPQTDTEEEKSAVGANESLIQSAIPNLLPGQAIVCLVLNVLIPGTGTSSTSQCLFKLFYYYSLLVYL